MKKQYSGTPLVRPPILHHKGDLSRGVASLQVEITTKIYVEIYIIKHWGPFHKSSYERFLLYEFVKPVLNYRSNEFVALTNLCETGPWSFQRWWPPSGWPLKRGSTVHPEH